MSTIEKLPQTCSAADVQGADSLWRVQFVAGKGEEIHSQCVDVNRDLTGGLHGIRVEIDVGFGGDAADFFKRLHGTEFVVGVHDGDEHGFRPDGAAKILDVNLSLAIGRKISYAHALFFERLASVEDGFMFDSVGNPMLFASAGALPEADAARVVTFGVARGETE